MIHSALFEKHILDSLEKEVLELLNTSGDFDNKRIVSNPRAVGDAVQGVLAESLLYCFPKGIIKEYKGKLGRRDMADVSFLDIDDNEFYVDIKTHNRDTSFNMPNLTSVERLSRFYDDDSNFFAVLLIEYSTIEDKIVFDKVEFAPIENFSWDCLTIGALGWGQIQIADANKIRIKRDLDRKEWMLQLCDKLAVFYPNEISKIKNRISHFEKVKSKWKNR